MLQEPSEFKADMIVVIENEADLKKLSGIEMPAMMGVDIECTSEVGYDGQICLIQMQIRETAYLIDVIQCPKEATSIRCLLSKIFENEAIAKIFYGGQQDLLWLQRDFQIRTKGFKDLKELTNKSLVDLWKQFCNYHTTKEEKKRFQKSDWYRRPLSQEQLEYAALDCYYLPYLYQLHAQNENQQFHKLMQKFMSKEYEQIAPLWSYYVKYANTHLPRLFQQFVDHDQNTEFIRYLQNSTQARSLVKFIFSEIASSRTLFAQSNNIPLQKCEIDEQLLVFSLLVFQQFKIEDLENYEPFYMENQHWDSPAKEVKDLQWNQYKNVVCAQLGHNFQNKEFVKYALTSVYNVEFFKDNQQQALQEKKELKKERFKQYQEKFTCKKPVYGDCKILSPEGLVLCNCDEKKVKWYLKNNLAELVDTNPSVIKLNFQPSGLESVQIKDEIEVNEKSFYTIERQNQCVVCGAKQHYQKFNIVPTLYKKNFPNHYKSHHSHDVVLLCVRCHEKAAISQENLKECISKKYDVPLSCYKDKKKMISQCYQLIKSLETYFKQKEKFPKEAKQKFKKNLRQNFKQIQAEVPENLGRNKRGEVKIDKAFQDYCIQWRKEQEQESNKQDFTNQHGVLVVSKFKNDKEIEEFIKIWRQNFIEQMQPQFLPEPWAIDHKTKVNFGKHSIFNEQK